jgi:hypothetical protein
LIFFRFTGAKGGASASPLAIDLWVKIQYMTATFPGPELEPPTAPVRAGKWNGFIER